MTRHYPGRVSPFGDLRIKAYLRLPEAFRSLSRPSSAISALASTLRSSSLDLACLLLLPKTSAFAVDGRSKPLCLSRLHLRTIACAPQPRLDFDVFVFPFHFPCAVFKVRLRPASSTLSGRGFRACVLWCPRHSALASLGRLLGLISTSWSFGFDSEGSSFLPILQNDTVFQSRFQSDPCPLGLNRFLCRFVVSVPLFLTSASTFVSSEARPRIRFAIRKSFLPRKEVIQPHLPIRLPCYDFTPVIGLTFDGCAPKVHSPASGAPNSHGVTGGVYKARERIHRGMLIRDY